MSKDEPPMSVQIANSGSRPLLLAVRKRHKRERKDVPQTNGTNRSKAIDHNRTRTPFPNFRL
jgi:hypothetical protein